MDCRDKPGNDGGGGWGAFTSPSEGKAGAAPGEGALALTRPIHPLANKRPSTYLVLDRIGAPLSSCSSAWATQPRLRAKATTCGDDGPVPRLPAAPEQPFDIGLFQLHIGRPAMNALAR